MRRLPKTRTRSISISRFANQFAPTLPTRRSFAACSRRRPCAIPPCAACSSTTACSTRCRRCTISTISATLILRQSIRVRPMGRCRNTTRFRCSSGYIDASDPPFNRHLGETPAMTAQDDADIVEFLKTPSDGYEPAKLATDTSQLSSFRRTEKDPQNQALAIGLSSTTSMPV